LVRAVASDSRCITTTKLHSLKKLPLSHTTLREAALSSGYIRAEEFDTIVVPAHMVGDPHKGLEETRKVVGP
jgi:hypothetical protein